MADIEIRQPVALRTVPNVELAAIGTWKASTGPTTFTDGDFRDAVAALACPGVRNPVVKLGHQEDDSTSGVRWDGEPALGWVAGMRYDPDGKLRGDLTGLPAWLADPDGNGLSVLAAAYPDRSIEIYRPFVCQIGHVHPAVITALSLIGVSAPGVGVLKSMQDVYAAWTQDAKAAASAEQMTKSSVNTTIRTSIGGTMPSTAAAVQASVSVESISRKYYESAGYSMWITALHVDPLELIVADDATGKFQRVPVELKGEELTFGEPQEVAIVYQDVKAAATALPYRWTDRREALSAQVGITDQYATGGEINDGHVSLPHMGKPTGATYRLSRTDPAPKVERTLPPAEAIKKVAAATVTTQTPDADVATGQPDKAEEATNVPFDAAKYREAFGLPDSLSDEEVREQALAALAPPTPAPTAQPATDPQTVLTAIPPEAGGAMLIDPENYKTLVQMAANGQKAFAEVQKSKGEAFLGQAMRDGRFPVSRLSAYQEMWAKNPEDTQRYIEMMPKNTVPVMAAGMLGAEISQNETDMVYEAFYGKGN